MASTSNERGATASRALTIGEGRGGVGEWRAYVKKNPQPDGLWWPLKWDDGRHSTSATPYADTARTHPSVFGVWREMGGSYTVAIKAEARRKRPAGHTQTYPAHEVKRKLVPDLLTLRTYLISLAKDPNCP